MVDFAKLKANRGKNLTALQEKLETMNKGSGGQKDERIYKPGFDIKKETGYAIIRFLPAKNGENIVRVFSHGFQGPGGWYFENSRSTIKEDDPVGISNSLYWQKAENDGDEQLKNFVRNRKRHTKYYANALIIKDSVTPEHEGKVMIYEFGAQVYKKIKSAAKPEFEDEESIDAFDLWTGADFKIKIVGNEMPTKSGTPKIVPNYENSSFATSSEFAPGDDTRKEELFNSTFDLTELAKVKTFDELANRFKKVTGEDYNVLETSEPGQSVAERLEETANLETNQTSASNNNSSSADLEEDEDTDDVLAMFERMSQE
jgi:hypothetical protein